MPGSRRGRRVSVMANIIERLADWSPAHKIRALQRQVETMTKIAAARERLLAEQNGVIAKCHAALAAIHRYETIHHRRRVVFRRSGALFTLALHQVEDAIALCKGTSDPCRSLALGP
jgi:hypothetical protein